MLRTLALVFGKTFYKKYAKLFIICFCLIFSYFFFMQIAGVFLFNSRDFWSLFLSIQVAMDPIFMLGFVVFATLYALFALNFMREELRTAKNQFLKHSFFILTKGKRWKRLAIVFLVINLPILLYSIYAAFVASILYHDFKGWLVAIYSISIAIISMLVFDRFAFRYSLNENISTRLAWMIRPNWPMFTINLLALGRGSSGLILIVKSIGILLLLVAFRLSHLNPEEFDTRFISFLALSLASVNAMLVYRDFLFQRSKMRFVLNFPLSVSQRYWAAVPFLCILLIPEFIFSSINLPIVSCLFFILASLIFILAIRTLISNIGNKPLMVLKVCGVCYFIGLILVLYNFSFFLMLFAFLYSFLFFRRCYRYEQLKDSQGM
ncbi:hypothetical protein GQF61_14260 [Sphingobacterium sp. DK4209]|nr:MULTISPECIES: hypothetical protein [unclassified Sphingobacterium]MVZ67021.1 hypothetical protein [Sphingobacterium sp. DK4209]